MLSPAEMMLGLACCLAIAAWPLWLHLYCKVKTRKLPAPSLSAATPQSAFGIPPCFALPIEFRSDKGVLRYDHEADLWRWVDSGPKLTVRMMDNGNWRVRRDYI